MVLNHHWDAHRRIKPHNKSNPKPTPNRTKPDQTAAQVARLLKQSAGAVTLAIGDGANDVSMIQVGPRLPLKRVFFSCCVASLDYGLSPTIRPSTLFGVRVPPCVPSRGVVYPTAAINPSTPIHQAAHIGVGISGREGRAAVQAADFAFGQFRSVGLPLVCDRCCCVLSRSVGRSGVSFICGATRLAGLEISQPAT
jgi:hypothetical protein